MVQNYNKKPLSPSFLFEGFTNDGFGLCFCPLDGVIVFGSSSQLMVSLERLMIQIILLMLI